MKQSRIESLIEISTNVGIGFVLAYLFMTYFIVPVYNLPVSHSQSFGITVWFTVLAITRGYLVRRYFNAGLHRAAHRAAVAIFRFENKVTKPHNNEEKVGDGHQSARDTD